MEVRLLPPEADKDFKEQETILVSEQVVHYPQTELHYDLIDDMCKGDTKKPIISELCLLYQTTGLRKGFRNKTGPSTGPYNVPAFDL